MAAQKLTEKQEKFVAEYLSNGGNGTAAARAAGYKGNVDTLKTVANENLNKPYIRARIDKAYEKIEKKGIASFEQKVELLWKIASVHSSPKYDDDGNESMVDGRVAIAAMAELNKMVGDLAAIKTDNRHTVVSSDALIAAQKRIENL